MMDIESSNNIIKDSIYQNIVADAGIFKNIIEFGYFKIGLFYNLGNNSNQPYVFYFGFYSEDFESIYEFSGKEMISTMYKDYECITEKQQNSNPYPVIFKISFEKYGKIFEKIPKDLKTEEKEKILYENEKTKKKLEEFANITATLFSEFKVNFYSSVIRKMVSLIQEKKETKPFVLKLNIDNNLYVVPQGDKISLAYGINFQQKTDKALARVFLQELEDTKRHLKNTVEAKYYPDNSKPPTEVDKLEKDPKRYSNGFLVITFFVKNYPTLKDKIGYYINLRMNKKGRELEKKLYESKIIPDNDMKEVQIMNFYSTFNKKDDDKEKKLFAQSTNTKVDV